jgi:K+-transporting ATPase KdpF subunit
MSTDNVLALIIAALLVIYLIAALLFPERF